MKAYILKQEYSFIIAANYNTDQFSFESKTNSCLTNLRLPLILIQAEVQPALYCCEIQFTQRKQSLNVSKNIMLIQRLSREVVMVLTSVGKENDINTVI